MMKPTLRSVFHVILFCTLYVLCSVFFLEKTSAEESIPEGGRKQSFLVSAYYSPLPNQSKYLRGNYEDEIRLNGRGTNGADGKEVYSGMLAAPKTYAFGTKIYIPGLGIGTVHDRGGAIVSTAGYDRIDIWMGRGEEALARALQWGMRRVEGVVYDDPSGIPETLSFDHLPAPQPVLTQLKGIFTKTLAPGSTGQDVEKLQKHLSDLGFFEGPQTGNYGPLTEEAVFQFQKSTRLVSSYDDLGAGVFGPRTREQLEKKIKDSPAPEKVIAASGPLKKLAFLPERIEQKSKGPEVKRLQIILKNLGYFSAELSEHYGPKTAEAVLAFQKSQKLALNEKSPGAGTFGPKTHDRLATVLEKTRSKRAKFSPQEAVFVLAVNDAEGKLASEPLEKILSEKKQLAFGDFGDEVLKLQETLIAGGFLEEGANTGYFGGKTKAAILELQQEHQLIPDETVAWAGVFGEKTERVLLQIS